MAFRFRRSIRILPGIRINLGKRSASLSVGGHGAHVTLRPGHKMRATVGLPGTGLSYTEGGGIEPHTKPLTVYSAPPAGITWLGWLFAAVVLAVIIGMVMNNLG
jgi:Protein of unknown function (DUF4236)